MKKYIISILVLLLLTSTSFVGVSNKQESIDSNTLETLTDGGLMNSSWPMFHHDVRHTGRSQYGPIGTWPLIKWKFWMEGLISSSPAIDKNDTIYIGTKGFHDKFFFAINHNGTEKWNYNPGDWVESSPTLSEDGTVYFTSTNGYLYALYPNGTIKWMFGIGWSRSSPTIGTDGTIYVGSHSHYFFAVNPNGTLRWSFETGSPVLSSAAIDDNGIIYIGSHDHYLYALNPNGTLKWKYQTSGEIKSPPSIGNDGTIYVCSWDNYLYAIAVNGTLKWRFGTGSSTETSPAIASDGTIYVGSYNGLLFSVTSNGSENWRFQTGNGIYSSPAIDKFGIIYCGSYDGYLYALNPDGTLRWKFDAGDNIESSVAIGEDGLIYIVGQFQPGGGQESHAYLYALQIINDQPPSTPIIDGIASGKIKQNYDYAIVSTDPEENTISYFVDWGDGTNTSWIGPYTSGDEQTMSHTWNKKGIYTIQVKAKDNYSAESEWGTLVVTMPYEPSQFRLLEWLLERFPNAFPILRYLIGFNK